VPSERLSEPVAKSHNVAPAVNRGRDPHAETVRALPTLIRAPAVPVHRVEAAPHSENRSQSSSPVAIDIPAIPSPESEQGSTTASAAISVADSHIVGNSSVSTDVTKGEVSIDIAMSSNFCSIQSFTNEQHATATATSVFTDDCDAQCSKDKNTNISNDKTPPTKDTSAQSPNCATHLNEEDKSISITGTNRMTTSAKSTDEFLHPSIVPDEFFLQCIFCFNEFEEPNPNATCLEPSIITPCGHRFHIECLKKDCDVVLEKKNKATTTGQSEESKEEPLMQCPHPFCQENISKSWAVENGLIRIQNENEAEDVTHLNFWTRNAETIERITHVFMCACLWVSIVVLVGSSLAYRGVIRF